MTSFKAQREQCGGLLRGLKLLDEQVDHRSKHRLSPAECRQLDYVDLWKLHRENRAYDLRLSDQSLIDFRIDGAPTKYSYTFLQCPLELETYHDFLLGLGREHHDVGNKYREDYEQEVATADLRGEHVTFRYDCDPVSYRCTAHPVAHLHTGIQTQVRIACRNHWSPLSFVLFVLRQVYPAHYDELRSKPAEWQGRSGHLRRKLKGTNWSTDDEEQFYLL